MNVEAAILEYARTPLREAVGPVAVLLAGQTVLVGIDGEVPTAGGILQLRTSADRAGGLWAHAFTSEAEIAKAFPQGAGCASVRFTTLFRLVASDPKFSGGLVINSSSPSAFPILRELFGIVEESLRSATVQKGF